MNQRVHDSIQQVSQLGNRLASVLLLACLPFVPTLVFGQVYSYTTATNGAPNTVAANVTGTNLSRVNGAGTPGSPCPSGFSSDGYSTTLTYSTALAAIEFTVTPNAGFQLDLTDISADLRRSSNGPASVRFAYSTDGGMTWTDKGSDGTPNNDVS